jgi:phenylpropionate dioxygenase-like ring-hydroxylating dioxygenase large terminal subunit
MAEAGAELTEQERQYPLGPSLLDAEVYRDAGRYRQELDQVLLNAWFPVAPSADLTTPREVLVWERLEQSVVIARHDDGRVSAWHNVCQHRGARLVEASGPCPSGRVVCPWHGFVYDLDGAVTNVPLRPSFDAEQLRGLRAPAVRVAEWSGWIWLCLGEGVPDLREYLGQVGDELDGYGLDRFTTLYRHSVTLDANWKIVVDAFNETWHVPFTHKDTLSGIIRWREAVLRITSPHSWMTIPVTGFTERATSDDHRHSHVCHYLVFPNTIFSCFPTHLQMWSAWPLSPERTRLDAHHIVGPTPPGLTDEKWRRKTTRDWEQFLEVLVEDSEVINNFARTIRSKGFRRNMFNTAESRLTAFHDEVEKRLTDGPGRR